MAKYIVIGGNPFRGYTGTLTYTGLRVVGVFDDKEAVKKAVEENYDACGGLMIAVDVETGEDV